MAQALKNLLLCKLLKGRAPKVFALQKRFSTTPTHFPRPSGFNASGLLLAAERLLVR
jgi:hypothetical protein